MALSYGALVAAILVGALGQLLLKAGAERTSALAAQFLDPFTIVGLGVYALAAVLYIVAIKRIPISIAFPSVAISYALVAVAAHFLWDEPIGWASLAGISLIAGGIVLLHISA
jgi:undecaprenyl phosphate-alpha-L-ara4N flippase subunit ArnE